MHQRKLPLLVAANTVNYGKPYKMNTAEALAASLHIAGLRTEAMALLFPFSYGQEFLKINHDLLEAYAACPNSAAVEIASREAEDLRLQRQNEKERRREERRVRHNASNIGGYVDEMDLPPMDSGDEYGAEVEDGGGMEFSTAQAAMNELQKLQLADDGLPVTAESTAEKENSDV